MMVLFMSPGVPLESCQAAVTVARGPAAAARVRPPGPGRPDPSPTLGPGPRRSATARTAAGDSNGHGRLGGQWSSPSRVRGPAPS